MNISTLCPTWQRPRSCELMIQSWLTNTKNSELHIYVQDGDPCHDEYVALSTQYPQLKWTFGPRHTTGVLWNKLYGSARADIIHLGSDDLNFRTKDWDEKVSKIVNEHFPDEVYNISLWEGNSDKHQGMMCRHPIVSRKMIERLGYFFPPFFIHYNVDCWWADITKAIGRFAIVRDIVVGHVRENATEENDWREEHKTSAEANRNDNLWAHRDKYVMRTSINRYKNMDIKALRKMIDK